MQEIILIAAYTKNKHIIGKNGSIPWNIPEEMSHFKRTTMGGAVIFGRKTFEKINKALPGRLNIILSISKSIKIPDVFQAKSLEDAINLCKEKGFDKIFICGGQKVYEYALKNNICSKMILSEVNEEYCENLKDSDAFFPKFSTTGWKLIKTENHPAFTITYFDKL